MHLFIKINILILLIIGLRAFANGRISKRLQYAMWISIPALCLLSSIVSIPVNFDSSPIENVFHAHKTYDVSNDVYTNHRTMFQGNNTTEGITSNSGIDANSVNINTPSTLIEKENEVDTNISLTNDGNNEQKYSIQEILRMIWFCGSLAVVIFFTISNVVFIHKITKERMLYVRGNNNELDVYISSYAKVPFLLGNKIYISKSLSDNEHEYRYAICHEESHYEQGDTLWLVVRYAFLAILWFDPLIWIANSLIKYDCEMSADEIVISKLGDNCKKDYSRSLVKYTFINSSISVAGVSVAYNGKNNSFIKARVNNIMNGTRKSIACSIVVSILLTALVGCSVVKPTTEAFPSVVEESDWFSNRYYLTNIYEGYDYASSSSSSNGSVLYVDSAKLILHEEFGKNSDGGVSSFACISQYALNSDGTTSLEYSVDLINLGFIFASDDYMNGSYVDNEYYINGKLYIQTYEWTSTGVFHHMYEISLSNGTVIREVDIDDLESLLAGTCSIVRSWVKDDSIFMLLEDYTNGVKYQLLTLDENFTITSNEGINGIDSPIGQIVPLDNRIYCTIDNPRNGTDSFVIDMESMNCNPINNSPAELIIGDWFAINGRMISADQYGVYEYNIDNNEIVSLMNYNQTNVNRKYVDSLHPIYVDEDCILMNCMVNSNYGINGIGYATWMFNKEDSNPNVGEKLIRVALLKGYIYEAYADAIYQYNEVSDVAFIVIDDRYIIDDYMNIDWGQNFSSEYNLSDEYRNAQRDAESGVSNQLRMDILEGIGPDIILDAYYLDDLSNSQYFVDLREELLGNEDINATDYINAVFDGDNEIYQLPLNLSPIGICWNEDYSSYLEDSYTLTYENYLTLVNDCCNGRDPIAAGNGRTDYFVELFKYYYSNYVDDGSINVDSDSFREMAEFVATRPVSYTDEDVFVVSTMANYSNWTSISDMNEYRITALPCSSSNEVIRLNCHNSIAISSSCNAKEEAMDFVKLVLDSFSDKITIEGIRNSCDEYADWYNNYDWDMPVNGFNGDETTSYIDIVQSTTQIYRYDSDVVLIVYEEIQAYFAGDKTIDDIIDIINNRAQTVLDEKQ